MSCLLHEAEATSSSEWTFARYKRTDFTRKEDAPPQNRKRVTIHESRAAVVRQASTFRKQSF